MSAKSSKTIWGFLLIAAIGLLAFVAATRSGGDRPVTVGITHAVRQDLSSWTTGNGKIEPIDARIIQSQLTTRIENIKVTEGRIVRIGDTLLTLDSTDARADLARLKEQLLAAQQDRKTGLQGGSRDEIAQIDNDLAKTNAEIATLSGQKDSLERLYAGQNATRLEVEQNRTALEKALADKRALEEKKRAVKERSHNQADRALLKGDEARESIASLEEKIKSARVASPITGTIYSLPAKAGTFVHTGDALAEVADLKQVRVRAFIDEPELGSLKEGLPVEITWEALPGQVWTGVVGQLPKIIVTRGSRNVGEVLCSVNNDEAVLLPNTNVNVRIRTAERKDILTLPRAAVHSEGNKHYVFVVENGRLKKQEVTVGISNPNVYELLGGITEKEAIAVQTDGDLREGQPIIGAEQ
jgi:HlyD family secretion protein